MLAYLQYFFNPRHLFTVYPNAMSGRAAIILLVCFTALVILAIVAKVRQGQVKDGLKLKAYRRLYHLGLTLGLLGYIYVFFAWQGVAVLGSRFWLLILFVIGAAWLGFIIKYIVKDSPKLRTEIDQKRSYQKYLP